MPDLTQEGLGHMPREDVKLPPPVGYISLAEHQALIREAEARVWREAAKEARECDYPWASPTNEQADACDQMAERIADWLDSRAAAAALRKDEEPK